MGCISGMPSATCSALAQTYSEAIITFGAVTLAALFSAVATMLLSRMVPRDKVSSKDRSRLATWRMFLFGVAYFFLGFSILIFLAGSSASSHNLENATIHCFGGQ